MMMLRMRGRRLFSVAVLAINVALLAGCASMPAQTSPDARTLVGAAGQSTEEERALYLALIRAMIDGGRPKAGLAYLEEYEKHWPMTAEILSLKGRAWLAVGDLSLAERAFEAAQANRPAAAEAHIGLGRIAAARGLWLDAMNRFRQGVDSEPTNVSALNNYGYALLKLGQSEEAFRWISRARELSPENVAVRTNYLIAASQSGRSYETASTLDELESGYERERALSLLSKWRKEFKSQEGATN